MRPGDEDISAIITRGEYQHEVVALKNGLEQERARHSAEILSLRNELCQQATSSRDMRGANALPPYEVLCALFDQCGARCDSARTCVDDLLSAQPPRRVSPSEAQVLATALVAVCRGSESDEHYFESPCEDVDERDDEGEESGKEPSTDEASEDTAPGGFVAPEGELWALQGECAVVVEEGYLDDSVEGIHGEEGEEAEDEKGEDGEEEDYDNAEDNGEEVEDEEGDCPEEEEGEEEYDYEDCAEEEEEEEEGTHEEEEEGACEDEEEEEEEDEEHEEEEEEEEEESVCGEQGEAEEEDGEEEEQEEVVDAVDDSGEDPATEEKFDNCVFEEDDSEEEDVPPDGQGAWWEAGSPTALKWRK